MKRNVFCAVVMSGLFLFGAVSSKAQDEAVAADSGVTLSKSAVDLKLAMRKLWEDHITWTRNYIISALAGLEGTDKVVNRLMKNQDEIGDAIKPYYGDDAGKKLASLLRDHISIAADVVNAAKAGDKAALDAAQSKWKSNADDIAVFLSGANSVWTIQELSDMLYKHLELTTNEVTSRLDKNWTADIEACDKGHVHMLMFSDVLTNGIAMQFPDKFNR